MKANKFLAVALAALALMACNKKDEPKQDPLKLEPTSLTLKVGETGQITANVGATWASNNEAVATVAPGNDGGKTAIVTAVAEGNAIISATANGETKTCVILVEKAVGPSGDKTIDAKRIWPVILDAVTAEKYASLIAGDVRVNEAEGNNLYIWAAGETYTAGDATGKNFFGNTEGYLALTVVAPAGWSGFGIHIENAASVEAMQAIKDAVAANPDKMFLHIAIKAANAGNHQMYLFADKPNTSFAIGTATIENGEVIGDFPRDGEWHEFDVPLAKFASAISAITMKADMDVFSVLSGATVGAQLNLDAIYFYEKK